MDGWMRVRAKGVLQQGRMNKGGPEKEKETLEEEKNKMGERKRIMIYWYETRRCDMRVREMRCVRGKMTPQQEREERGMSNMLATMRVKPLNHQAIKPSSFKLSGNPSRRGNSRHSTPLHSTLLYSTGTRLGAQQPSIQHVMTQGTTATRHKKQTPL